MQNTLAKIQVTAILLLRDFCEISARFLRDFCEISARFLRDFRRNFDNLILECKNISERVLVNSLVLRG